MHNAKLILYTYNTKITFVIVKFFTKIIIKGGQSSLIMLVDMLKKVIFDSESQTINIAHAGCNKKAKFIKEKVLSEIGCKEVCIKGIGPIIGGFVDAMAITIFDFGKKAKIGG